MRMTPYMTIDNHAYACDALQMFDAPSTFYRLCCHRLTSLTFSRTYEEQRSAPPIIITERQTTHHSRKPPLVPLTPQPPPLCRITLVKLAIPDLDLHLRIPYQSIEQLKRHVDLA